MEEVEVVILRISLTACNPGCLHLVLESVSPKVPYLLENRTAHPFQHRQASLDEIMPAFHMVEVQEAYGKQSPQRYPLDSKGTGRPLASLSLEGTGELSVQPGEVLIVDREQELMSTAGLQSLGGGAGLGQGGLHRELRIALYLTVVSKKGPNGELAVLGLASANDESGNTLYLSLHIWAAQFLVALSPDDIAEEASEYHPLLSLAVISQPGLARGQTCYPLISFQISKTLQISLSETLVWRAAKMVQRLDPLHAPTSRRISCRVCANWGTGVADP
ncbi:TPA: hypothetical protein ACH3X3_005085 [Trebouxia sp. C0006]